MTKVALFSGGDLSFFTPDFDFFVGIDRGSLFLVQQDLPLNLAVGDFDSVSESEFATIKQKAGQIITASPQKNDTDTELALKVVFEQFPNAQVTIFGAFGGRLDHTLSNVFLPSDPELAPFMSQMTLRDQQNSVSYRPKGTHVIHQEKEMAYVAFMTSDDADLVITGAKFDLTEETFFKKKVYASNEFNQSPITVCVPTGYLVIIQSKDRS